MQEQIVGGTDPSIANVAVAQTSLSGANNSQSACPGCGRCRCCGQPFPYNPYGYPNVPYYPLSVPYVGMPQTGIAWGHQNADMTRLQSSGTTGMVAINSSEPVGAEG